ncbi:MAG TPA: hypothetical protein DCZ94_00520 [Lentisphaeria bacterium]|nr:MAG: hypothetical protein A2X48_12080 [Lentisphaerae bacterium GWF2_49_21]HBC85415.1 hypothetical protein [Lentisphaeria bacterium]
MSLKSFLVVLFNLLVVMVLAAGEGLDIKTLEKIKKATVFIKIKKTYDSREYRGSGFFVAENIVATSFHIFKIPPNEVNDFKGEISVIVNSGLKDIERKIPGKLLVSDVPNDIAFIQLPKDYLKNIPDGLPEPIKFSEDDKLNETTSIHVLGYPFGELLADKQKEPYITIGQGSISSIRRNPDGDIGIIQIDGDMNPGNSGGPIVDDAGRLVAMSCAGMVGTEINFGIPAREIKNGLGGRPGYVFLTKKIYKDDKYSFDVNALPVDPAQKIKSVQFQFWHGDNPRTRCSAENLKYKGEHGVPGDGPLQNITLKKLQNGIWKGKVTEYVMPKGSSLWFVCATKGDCGEIRSKPTCQEAMGWVAMPSFFEEEEVAEVKWMKEPLADLVTSKENPMDSNVEQDEKGLKYASLTLNPATINMPENILQIVCPPSGKEIYAICRDYPKIKVFDPKDFSLKAEIRTPKYPISIACDEKYIAVVCNESKVFTIIDSITKEPIKSIINELEPGSSPSKILGRAPNGGFITRWDLKTIGTINKEYAIASMEGLYPLINATGATYDRASPFSNGRYLLLFEEGSSQIAYLDLNTLKLFSSHQYQEIRKLLSKNIFDDKRYRISSGSCSYDNATPIISFQDDFYMSKSMLFSPDLKWLNYEIPGTFIREVPQKGYLVTWLKKHTKNFNDGLEVYYVARSSGRILRKIYIKYPPMPNSQDVNYVSNYARCANSPTSLYVPGYELLIWKADFGFQAEKWFSLRCGPIKEEIVFLPNLTLKNAPGSTITAEENYEFTPEIIGSVPENIKFKLEDCPTGMSIDPNTGKISWKPGKAYIGDYDLCIIAGLSQESISLCKWTLSVKPK